MRRRTRRTYTTRETPAREIPARFAVYQTAQAWIDDTRARLADIAARKDENAQAWTEHANESATRTDPNFFGPGAKFAECETMQNEAAPDTIQTRADEIAAEIADGLTAREIARKWTRQEDGEELDPARLLDFLTGNGDARIFARRRRIVRPAKLATIVFPAILTCAYSAKDFEERGAEAAAAVAALEARGFSTAIYMENSSKLYHGALFYTHSFFPAKRHGEPLDLSALWYAVRPEITRRAGFMDIIASAALAGMDAITNHALGTFGQAGKEAACNALGIDPAQTIYFDERATPEEMRAQLIKEVNAMQNGENAAACA